MNTDHRNQMLEAMEQARDAVAALNGLRQQFIDAGWDEHNAEHMVIAIVHQGGGH